jgi:hypothetical protein
MSGIRVHSKGFSIAPNEIMDCFELSFEARFVLIYLTNRPDGWVVRNADLVNKSKAGPDKIKSILREIQQAGFMHRWREREQGKFVWRTEVFQSRRDCEDWKSSFNQSGFDPHGESTRVDSPPWLDQPGYDPHIVNNELINNDLDPDLDLGLDPLSTDPDREREKSKSQKKSTSLKKKTELIVAENSIGEDDFSVVAKPREFPIGPWGDSLFTLHSGFIAWKIAQWRKGNTEKSKAFGAMADEEVQAAIQRYWKKDYENLQIDWQAFYGSTKRLLDTVDQRVAQGVEISESEQSQILARISESEQVQLSFESFHSLSPSELSLERSIEVCHDVDEVKTKIDILETILDESDDQLWQASSVPSEDFYKWLQKKSCDCVGLSAIEKVNLIKTLAIDTNLQNEYLRDRRKTS